MTDQPEPIHADVWLRLLAQRIYARGGSVSSKTPWLKVATIEALERDGLATRPNPWTVELTDHGREQCAAVERMAEEALRTPAGQALVEEEKRRLLLARIAARN